MNTALASRPLPIQPLYINGECREGCEGAAADDVNPATGEVFARVAQAGRQDVEDALASAHAARVSWAALLVNEREALLLRTADIIARRAEEIRDLIIEETGSVMMKAPWEVGYAVECLRSAAACTRQPHGSTFPPSAKGQVGMTIRQPPWRDWRASRPSIPRSFCPSRKWHSRWPRAIRSCSNRPTLRR